MPSVRTGPAIGLFAQVVLLVAVAGTTGLSGPSWAVGISCGLLTNLLLARALARSGADSLTPADRVTLLRATLVGGVAALTTESLVGSTSVTMLVSLTVVALVLDAVDGWVARRTVRTSRVGARFDMEVDAFLILVLSIYVAPSAGGWVLAIGAMRYAFGAAGWLLPWMRRDPPPRYWCKVVAATQGIVLAFAAADLLPRTVTNLALVVALALLLESFGREAWWLWRHRPAEPVPAVAKGTGRGARAVVAGTATTAAGLLVWFALVAPDRLTDLRPSAFVRIPVEGLVLVAVGVVLPVTARRIVAGLVGLLLGVLTIVKVLDMAFLEELDRPFNPVGDWGAFGPAVGVLRDSVGRTAATGFVIAAVVVVGAILILMPLAVIRLTRLAARHQTGSIRTVLTLGLAWVLCAVFGAEIVTGAPIASTSAAVLAFDQVLAARHAVQDRQVFANLIARDAYRNTPGSALLDGLRGKDVVIAFVESYGRVAVQDSAFSPRVDAVLDAGTSRLRAAGFSSRSAFLTSPTFGGISWLAHSTLQSGRWVDTQQRYDQLVKSNRLTLSGAFERAGWRTVSDVPSNDEDWPEGRSFYHYDQLYDIRNVGYHGPSFSYASMPDQYVLSAFHRLELAQPHDPVMAEIDLVSSHTPWAPLPRLVPWAAVGDGTVYDGMPDQGRSPDEVWPDAGRVQAAYGHSIEYTLKALVSFVLRYGDKNLVLIVVGDHQPATIVSGQDAGHDVPITIIAHDRAVTDRIARWGWQDGMRPGPQAPVWPMSAFRNRFLKAYGYSSADCHSALCSSR